jgi:succinoglycan biosynthesis transport protein ExoP
MDESDLSGRRLESLRVLRRRWWVVALCVVLAGGAAYGISSAQQKKYSATAGLLFRNAGFDTATLGSPFFAPDDPARQAATNLKLVQLAAIFDRTAQALGGGITSDDVRSAISIDPEGQSSIVSVTATDSDPARAQRLANGFADQFIKFRQDADRLAIERALALTKRELSAMSPEVRRSQRGRLLTQRADQLATLSNLQTGNVEKVQAADKPSSPSSPKPRRNGLIGGLLGLLLGLAAAAVMNRFDRKLREPDELGAAFQRPLLAAIPESKFLAGRANALSVSATTEAEAFRMLRANLRYFNVDRDVRSVMVTSASPGDGKTTVACNRAAAAAAAGSKVLLVEADLRRPTLAGALSLRSSPGLSNVLARQAEPEDVVQKTPVVEGTNGSSAGRTMDVIVAGPLPPNPVDLIESERMRQLLTDAERDYELVVIDTPPTAAVSDAIALTRQVRGVIVVGRLGVTTRDAIAHLRRQLENLDAPTLGVVVNSVSRGDGGYYVDAYGYGYAAPPDQVDKSLVEPSSAAPAAVGASEPARPPGDDGGSRNDSGGPSAPAGAVGDATRPARRSGGLIGRMRGR